MKKLLMFLAFATITAGCEQNEQSYDNLLPDNEQGVLINGVRWAEFNVNAPGTLTANPKDIGMYYQFNRRQGWVGDEFSDQEGVDCTDQDFPAWTTENDPCPTGWRLPVWDELEKLCDVDAVQREWLYNSAYCGILFTDRNTGESIFLPAANSYLDGGREIDGTPSRSALGCYWSSTEDILLTFEGGYYNYAGKSYNHNQSGLYQVRCILADK